MKKLIMGLVVVLCISNAMAAEANCKRALYNADKAWVGESYTNQFPGEAIQTTMRFNKGATEMWTQDPVDQQWIDIPVTVTCLSSTEFTLKDNFPENPPPVCIYMEGSVTNNTFSFKGTKTYDAKTYGMHGELHRNLYN